MTSFKIVSRKRSGHRQENAAAIPCVECGRRPRPGELWRLYFADIGEVAIYCPECAEREFGDSGHEGTRRVDGD